MWVPATDVQGVGDQALLMATTLEPPTTTDIIIGLDVPEGDPDAPHSQHPISSNADLRKRYL